eukprot:8887218-Pyramimonas_sp.AAC.2
MSDWSNVTYPAVRARVRLVRRGNMPTLPLSDWSVVGICPWFSFNKMKKRLGSRSSGGFLFVERPFFDVEVELRIPSVNMNPSLEEIQQSINETAKKVLRCAKDIQMWDSRSGHNFYELIARDKEIVK